jgi:hypothetical protein
MLVLMLFSIIFGVIYTDNTLKYSDRVHKYISENSQISIDLSENMNQFDLYNNVVISNCIKGEEFNSHFDKYYSLKDKFELTKPENKKVDSLIFTKKQVLNRIYFEKVKSRLTIQNDSLILKSIIYVNNLDYQIDHLLNFKISILNKRNLKFQNNLSVQLKDRFTTYIFTMLFNLILFFVVSWFLFTDIRKKSKSDERRKDFISALLNRK